MVDMFSREEEMPQVIEPIEDSEEEDMSRYRTAERGHRQENIALPRRKITNRMRSSRSSAHESARRDREN